MSSKLWRQSGRGRSRIAVVAPIVALLATTMAAMPQQDTSAAARAVRVRRAKVLAGTRDSVSARSRAKSSTTAPTESTSKLQEPQAAMPPLIGLDTLSAVRLLLSKKMVRHVVQLPTPDLIP